MRAKKKDSMNWLFNQEDAKALIKIINAREFTAIEAVVLHMGSYDKEVLLETMTSIVQYNNPRKQVLK